MLITTPFYVMHIYLQSVETVYESCGDYCAAHTAVVGGGAMVKRQPSISNNGKSSSN